jgi:hypothetical protein
MHNYPKLHKPFTPCQWMDFRSSDALYYRESKWNPALEEAGFQWHGKSSCIQKIKNHIK